MAKKAECILEDEVETFVPDAQARFELGNVTAMTMHRWDKNPPEGFPAPIIIHGRKYRSRKQLEEFKRQMVKQAMANRHRLPAA